MYIHRSVLLILMVMVIFSPTITEWISNSHTAWYRPYAVWICVIGLSYLVHGKRHA